VAFVDDVSPVVGDHVVGGPGLLGADAIPSAFEFQADAALAVAGSPEDVAVGRHGRGTVGGVATGKRIREDGAAVSGVDTDEPAVGPGRDDRHASNTNRPSAAMKFNASALFSI
jgi:hypothetical protein